MSVRVVARIRPLLKAELEKDVIVESACSSTAAAPTIVRIPNPKNPSESYSFNFHSVYGEDATQQSLFDNEVAPTVKHLFNGFDVTLFAYGVTGTGKTHTMRGGKTLADRGVIPRLLSSIYRKGRKIEKDTANEARVEVTMSYYEIYNDKVFDLFEPPENRTATGLPIRDNNGKTIVAGLTERPCSTLKDFEQMYDEANVNRSTGATKLNAHSSRSHAILCVRVSQIYEDRTIMSTISAIDLAGSEDNRRTENGKERLVESSAINKSLFVLAQCVEAISKKQSRIPYRESKMTRILSLGQNNGLTIMILNLAPVKSYHLDTLSSLNFANRTKKIEVREVENEPIFKNPKKLESASKSCTQPRRPLQSIPTAMNINLNTTSSNKQKPMKTFSVYAEKTRSSLETSRSNSLKRPSDTVFVATSRPSKVLKPIDSSRATGTKEAELSRSNIEEFVTRMVEEKLASRISQSEEKAPPQHLSLEVQRRLEALEERVEKKHDSRAEGLQYLLMAKQHQVRGEDASAMRMYELALPYFPENDRLAQKMLALGEKIREERYSTSMAREELSADLETPADTCADNGSRHKTGNDGNDDGFGTVQGNDFCIVRPRNRKAVGIFGGASLHAHNGGPMSPRTTHLLRIINSRDSAQIRSLKGVGAKKADSIINALCTLDEDERGAMIITDLNQLGEVKGVGLKSVELMRSGLCI